MLPVREGVKNGARLKTLMFGWKHLDEVVPGLAVMQRSRTYAWFMWVGWSSGHRYSRK